MKHSTLYCIFVWLWSYDGENIIICVELKKTHIFVAFKRKIHFFVAYMKEVEFGVVAILSVRVFANPFDDGVVSWIVNTTPSFNTRLSHTHEP